MTGTPTNDDLRSSAAHVLLSDPSDLVHGDITPDDDVEHHLRRVLRLREGEAVSVTDGEGRWRMYAVRSGPHLGLEPTTDVEEEPEPSSFTLASAIPKGDRVDWLVQKVTELGARRIVLLHCDRSTVRWKADRATKQTARLQRIADEALRQSRRVWRCTVNPPVDAHQVLFDAAVAEPEGRQVSGDESMIAVGPEGGWAASELEHTRDSVSLGAHILRTETAGLVATTLRMSAHY